MTEKILVSGDIINGDNHLDIQFQHNSRFRTGRTLESYTENHEENNKPQLFVLCMSAATKKAKVEVPTEFI